MDRKAGELFRGISADAEALQGNFHKPMRTLLAYWDKQREGGPAIPRSSLDPIDIPKLLPNVFLVDRVSRDPFDIVFRLLGTRIVENEGRTTGARLSEIIPRGPEAEVVWAQYECALAGEVCLRNATLAWQGRGFVPYDVLLLPMTRTGDDIDSALGMALYGPEYRELP